MDSLLPGPFYANTGIREEQSMVKETGLCFGALVLSAEERADRNTESIKFWARENGAIFSETGKIKKGSRQNK